MTRFLCWLGLHRWRELHRLASVDPGGRRVTVGLDECGACGSRRHRFYRS